MRLAAMVMACLLLQGCSEALMADGAIQSLRLIGEVVGLSPTAEDMGDDQCEGC